MFSYDEETGKTQHTRGDTTYIEVYAEDDKGSVDGIGTLDSNYGYMLHSDQQVGRRKHMHTRAGP